MFSRLAKLNDRHHEICRLIVLGKSNEEIAKEVGLQKSTIAAIRGNPLVRDKVSKLSNDRDETVKDLKTRFSEMSDDALEALHSVIKNDDGSVLPNTQLVAIKYVLGVLGCVPPTNNKHLVMVAAMPQERLMDLKNRLTGNMERAGLLA